MCGRYVRRSDKQKIAEHFRAKPSPPDLPMPDADYNVAPSTHQPIIRQSRETGEREMTLARWGLVPFSAKDLDEVKGLSTINARCETAHGPQCAPVPMRTLSSASYGGQRQTRTYESVTRFASR